MFVMLSAVAIALWAPAKWKTVKRKRAIDRIEAMGGTVTFESSLPPRQPRDPIGSLRRMLGDRAVIFITVPVAKTPNQRGISEAEEAQIRTLFPELDSW